MQLRRAVLVLAAVVHTLGMTGPAQAAALESVGISVGVRNYAKDNPESELGVELRLAPRKWKIAPMTGLAATDERAAYIYGGLRRELLIGSRWSLTPSFAVSLYEDGGGHDLGGPIEFRSALEVSYPIGRRSRVGISIYHLSNARIYENNPGSNSIIFTLSLPISGR